MRRVTVAGPVVEAHGESERHQNYFPAGTTADAVVPPRNFSPLISDGMIIRGDISHESGTWLNVDFIAAVRGRGWRRRGRGTRARHENFSELPKRHYEKGRSVKLLINLGVWAVRAVDRSRSVSN